MIRSWWRNLESFEWGSVQAVQVVPTLRKQFLIARLMSTLLGFGLSDQWLIVA